jgi:gentisate 1,2-dioxygenase
MSCSTACEPGSVTAGSVPIKVTTHQVFDGKGAAVIGGVVTHKLDIGDIFVIPSWIPWSLQAETQFDLFRFSDAPIMERLHFMRSHVETAEA